MRCFLCHRDLPTRNVEHNGSFVDVCRNCEEYALEKVEEKVYVTSPKKVVAKDEDIIENIGVLIMKKRMQMGLKQEELAQRIGIKASLLAKIESGKLEIDLNLARRLERILNVRLVSYNSSVGGYSVSETSDLTIGDLMKK